MSGEERSLPEGWEIPELGDLIELQNGFAFSSADYSNQGHFLIRIGNVQDTGIVLSDPKKVCLPEDGSLDRFNLEKGDILTSLTGNVGRIAVIEEQHLPAALNQRVAKISLINAEYLTKPYLLRFLRSDIFKSELIESGHGAAQQNVSTKEIAKISIPLAPLAEQKVIADTLEVLLAQVDTLQARLDAIPAILKRFRQSVLSAAVTGKLTEEWRITNHGDIYELNSLLEERMFAIREFGGKSRTALGFEKDLWPENPDNWLTVSIDQISILVTDGDHNPPKRVECGVPYLTAKNVKFGRLIFDGCSYVSDAAYDLSVRRYMPIEGDVLITCVGTIGETALVPGCVKFCPDRNLAAMRTIKIVDPSYLKMVLDSIQVQFHLRNASGSSAQPHIYLGDLRQTAIPLPPLPEQHEIVRRVEELFALADQIEKRVEEARSRAKHLTQSILAKAFRGELTAQWRAEHPEQVSGENSAQALLERIRAARTQAPEKGKRGRKPVTESVKRETVAAEGTEPRKRGRPRKV